MAQVTLEAMSVIAGGVPVLEHIDLAIPDGEFVAVVGPSGIGKSTLLRTIAGLEMPSHGRVLFDAVDVTSSKPADRDIGMVFQTPVLLPNRNVRRNVQFPLEIRRETVESIRNRVDAQVRALHLEHLVLRRPDELSRGEEQMVQIARALVRSPSVLLLDEPFAPLDDHLRHRMRAEVRLLQAGYGVTTFMASNDPADAFALAATMVVLGRSTAGARIVQVGSPLEVHREPVSLSVATATGPLWTVPALVTADGGGFWLTDGTDAPDGFRLRVWPPSLERYRGRRIVVGFRSGELHRDDDGDVTATLEQTVPGAPDGLLCQLAGNPVHASGDADESEIGGVISLRATRPLMFDADSGDRIA